MAEHIVPPRTYLLVYVALLLLTAATVGFSLVPVGTTWHTLVGLTIATVKATLVILFFMHVLYSTRLTWLVALSGLVWVAILIGLTLTDYLSRSPLPLPHD